MLEGCWMRLMNRYWVTFTELDAPKAAKELGTNKYLIDASHIGMIMKHSTYTTLMVDGVYLHIEELYDEVMHELSWVR